MAGCVIRWRESLLTVCCEQGGKGGKCNLVGALSTDRILMLGCRLIWPIWVPVCADMTSF
jgi:hypothetical protein